MAPVVNYFKSKSDKFETIVAITAQHREMLDQVLSLFKINPDYDLDLMSTNQSLETLTSKILLSVSELIKAIEPNILFVQGDTATAMVSSLAAFYQKIPVAHIEAGLRTNNKYSPFPEEINRKIISSIASYHFPPTTKSEQNLLNEGISSEEMKVTGNTVIDALLSVNSKLDSNMAKYEEYFINKYALDLNIKKNILVTGHRRESFGKGFESICKAIEFIAKDKSIQIIYPVHLNPNVQEPVNRILADSSNIYLIDPQDYVPFIFLMKKSNIILTDSGGVQEEAPSLGKPVLVMRENTERPEGVEEGTTLLVGTDYNKIIKTVNKLLNNQVVYEEIANKVNPYGDGYASKYIYKATLKYLDKK
jgi:UDP-N-acetylglucosamine 2-epimerase (non-hydrolysing)